MKINLALVREEEEKFLSKSVWRFIMHYMDRICAQKSRYEHKMCSKELMFCHMNCDYKICIWYASTYNVR